ncbi:hypothetical protein [Mesorhizobium sp. BHbdii]
MLQPKSTTPIADEVPWSDSITSYDRQHRTIYLRILDACAYNASVEEMADRCTAWKRGQVEGRRR